MEKCRRNPTRRLLLFTWFIMSLATLAPCSGQSRWEWSCPPQGGDLKKIVFGNERFVAIGSRTISVSMDNGTLWTSKIPEQIVDLLSIAFGADVFVVTGKYGYLSSSADGVNWTSAGMPDSLSFYGVAYGNGRFVAIGTCNLRGYCYTSVDGISWTRQAEYIRETVLHTVFANGVFLVSGYGNIFGSIDGVSWKQLASIENFAGIGSVHDRFFVRRRAGEVGLTLVSGDGKTWRTMNTEYDETISLAGRYENGEYYFYCTGTNVALTSPDCSTFTKHSTGSFEAPHAIAKGPSATVALTSYGGVWASRDGISWAQQTAGTIPRQLCSIAFGNGRFVAIDRNAKNTMGKRSDFIISSADAKTWTGATGEIDVDYFNSVAFVNGHFMITGSGGKIVRTPDGRSLTVIQTPDTSDLMLCSYASGNYVVTTSSSDKIYVSDDLTEWTPLRVDFGGSINGLFSVNGRFVFCNKNLTSLHFTDGNTPVTELLKQSEREINSIAYGNDKYVGVGHAQIFSSDDGVKWIAEDLTSLKFHSLVFGNNQFAAIVSRGTLTKNNICFEGTDQVFATSPDGVHWTLHNSGISQNLYAMAYGDSQFVAVGANGAIMISKADDPNRTFSKAPRAPRPYQIGIAVAGNRLLICTPSGYPHEDYTITLASIAGIKFFSGQMESVKSTLCIPVAGLIPGVYLAAVSHNGQTIISRQIMRLR